jgi:4-amino-4-deoxy-L-arabinose transferase-like glycosyltransferase
VIGLLAAVLRLWAIDRAPFAYDEVDVLGRVRAVLGGQLTSTGPMTSWGIPDPPVSVYLVLPAAVLPQPALAAAAWIALLNVAAVVLTYQLARRFLGPPVALAAGLLFAVNPWSIYFSRRTWAELVPLFTVVALWAAFEVICRGRARWAVPFFLALALQVQTRILALVYVPAVLLTLVPFPRRWGVFWPTVGILLGVVVSLPYLVYVASHWSELSAALSQGNRGIALETGGSSAPGAPQLLIWTAAGYGLLPASSAAAPWLTPLGQAGWATLWLVGALIAAGLAMAMLALGRRVSDWPALVLPAAWLVAPVAALGTQSSSVYLHYMVALFPAVFLVMALPLGALLASRRPFAPLLGGALLAAICAVQVVTTGTLYRMLAAYDLEESASSSVELRQAVAAVQREASEQLGTGERYGVEVPLNFWQAVAERTHAEAARAGVREIWVLAGATDPLTAERPAILDYLLRPGLEPRFLPVDAIVFPVGRPALVLEAPDVDSIESIERFGTRVANILIPSTNRAGRDSARLTLIEAKSAGAWEQIPPSRNRAAFEGGVELIGYRSTRSIRAGEDLPVLTYWRLGPNAPDVSERVSVRLVEPSGSVIARPSPVSLPSLAGLEGERILIRRHFVPVPAEAPSGRYRLEAVVDGPAGGLTLRTGGRGDHEFLARIEVSAR